MFMTFMGRAGLGHPCQQRLGTAFVPLCSERPWMSLFPAHDATRTHAYDSFPLRDDGPKPNTKPAAPAGDFLPSSDRESTTIFVPFSQIVSTTHRASV